MIAGLDFGTSNSAIGIYQNTQTQLLPLFEDAPFLPSTLYTLDRSFVCDYLYNNLPKKSRDIYKESRLKQLQRADATRRSLDIRDDERTHYFGEEAIKQYIEFPEDGLFIKSPKSFLGSTGLSEHQLAFFEDLVAAMILNIKLSAEKQLPNPISQVVIGRPVNFQGVDSDKSNLQAIQVLTRATSLCGYKKVEFLYEPLAAGIDFETHLEDDKQVLVIDIGGGTTDCSMVKMGPSFINNDDRSSDFLAHTGQRIGGNDLDIHLAFYDLMPLFGLGTFQKKGIEIPKAPYWSAASINHVGEQTRFASQDFVRQLTQIKREAKRPELIERLIHLQKTKLNHRLVRSAELAKMSLSDQATVHVNLDYIETNLNLLIGTEEFENAISRPLSQIQALIEEALKQAGTHPDLVYITGGSAKSPTVRKAVNKLLPGVQILDGDYYGSVATGLTKWANRIWR